MVTLDSLRLWELCLICIQRYHHQSHTTLFPQNNLYTAVPPSGTYFGREACNCLCSNSWSSSFYTTLSFFSLSNIIVKGCMSHSSVKYFLSSLTIINSDTVNTDYIVIILEMDLLIALQVIT